MQKGVAIRFVFEVLRIQIDQIPEGFSHLKMFFVKTYNTIQASVVESLRQGCNFWHCFSRPGAWNVWPIRMVGPSERSADQELTCAI